MIKREGQVAISKIVWENFEVKEKETVTKPSVGQNDIVDEYVSIGASKLNSRVDLEQMIEEEGLERIDIY
ncbi:MAG: hypothetical protein QXN62_02165 [Candidatus Bathyarchaeia archaeon]